MAMGGKYRNYHVMRRDASLHSALPQTEIFRSDNFHRMIDRYGSVIVKPAYGEKGIGIIKVSYKSGGKYIIHTGAVKKTITGKTAAFAYVKRLTKSKPNIVQRYIALAKVNGRPLDLRVMVQRKEGEPWAVTGKLAKVAGANHFITNVARSKGYVLPAMEALTKTFTRERSSSILKELDSVALRAAEQIGEAYNREIIGFDMAVDDHGKTWIIEQNPKPALSLFLKLKDKSQYRTILRYKRT